MKQQMGICALVISGLAAIILGAAAPVWAGPSEAGSAQDTVNHLEAEGYTVILNKVGSAALHECTVTAVRPGSEIRAPGTSRVGGRDPVQRVLSRTVYVDVKC